MGEYMFGVGSGKLTHSRAKKIDRIARKHGAEFVWGNIPGQGHRYWFTCPNLGSPFDQGVERDVWAALESAGLADENGIILEST